MIKPYTYFWVGEFEDVYQGGPYDQGE